MSLSYIQNMPKKKAVQLLSFGGLNLSDSTKAGELRVSRNLSSDRHPYLTTRKKRTTLGTYTRPTALFDWDGLIVVDGTSLMFDGETVGTVTAGEKQFAVINTKLIIWPDKKYLDLTSNEFKPLEAALSSPASNAVFTSSTLKMDAVALVGSADVQIPYTSENMLTVKVYTSVLWTEADGWTKNGEAEKLATEIEVGDIVIPTKIEASGAYVIGFKAGDNTYPAENNDGRYFEIMAVADNAAQEYRWEYFTYHNVTVGGETVINIDRFIGYIYGTEDEYPDPGIADYGGESYYFANRTESGTTGIVDITYDDHSSSDGELLSDYFKAGDVVTISGCMTYPENNIPAPSNDTDKRLYITNVTDDTITFDSAVFTAGSEAGAVTVTKLVPDFSFICAHKNRLWGVQDQTIYASALGDPSTFFDYSNLSTDSYAAPVDTKGEFTGCCSYSDDLIFFKEDMLYRVVGNYPSEYGYAKYNLPGLQAGSYKSLQIINEVLYYKAKTGIYAYTGGTPQLISYQLGLNIHSNAVAGTDGIKYYVSMLDADGLWGLYVYDTLHGGWLREDVVHVADFTYQYGILCFMDLDSGAVIGVGGEGDEDDFGWTAELVEIDAATLNKKHFTKIAVRMDLSARAWLKVETSCDRSAFKQVYLTHDDNAKTFTIPLLPVRCDEIRIRLSGMGQCIIKSIECEYSVGSDL